MGKTRAVEPQSPWVVTRNVDIQESKKEIDGSLPFYLFIYITLSKLDNISSFSLATVLVNFEFFSKEELQSKLNMGEIYQEEIKTFVNENGTGIADKVAHITEYTVNKSTDEFNYKIIYNETDTLHILKELARKSILENHEDKLKTIIYRPLINLNGLKVYV